MAQKRSKKVKFVFRGKKQGLSKIPFHHDVLGISRYLLLNDSLVSGAPFVAVHFVKGLPKKVPEYTEPHSHDCDEVNLVLSESGTLKYKFVLGSKSFVVSSPACIFIPRGVRHSCKAVSGVGVYVVFLQKGNYQKSLLPR